MMTRMETIEQGVVIESTGVVREGLLEEVTSELRPEGRGVLPQRVFQVGGNREGEGCEVGSSLACSRCRR